MKKTNIRNFCIIAHIDHGKSTLADRFLELTKTIEKRKMQDQFLDMMELEREKGITIKMQPVRMIFKKADREFILNLIDTPGHIDFSYEVSRSLKAVEGAILLIDATQGVQAQTITNLEMAKNLGLAIIPVINKIDRPTAQIEKTKKEIMEILGSKTEEILKISAKTGENVELLLEKVVKLIPPPKSENTRLKALVFDFNYSLHRGIILYVRVYDGLIKKGDELFLYQAKKQFKAAEVGIFTPAFKETPALEAGEIGYVITNIKTAESVYVGDTLMDPKNPVSPFSDFKKPMPMVWASIYPENQDNFQALKQSLSKLHLLDSALIFEEEKISILGRGFKCGFLGMLHLEIVLERLKREFNLKLIVTSPSVVYKIEEINGGFRKVYSAAEFPDYFKIKRVMEPWINLKIITPYDKLNPIIVVLKNNKAEIGKIEKFGEARLIIYSKMPLRKLMKNFFDNIKSASSGYASLAYEQIGDREGDLTRLDILINNEIIPAFSRIIEKSEKDKEARFLVEKLKSILPPALFEIKIQAKVLGKILAAARIPAIRKDVTGHLYGGDITRKMKLWKKQKEGKKKMKKYGKIKIPESVFLKMVQS